MLKSRKELIELIEFGNEIKEIINLWDPMGLMDFCPEDEYETEVKGIRNLVVNNKNMDKKSLGQEIRNIFEYYFSNEYKSKQKIEEDIASKIIEKSKEYKLNFTLPNYYDTKKIIFKNQKEADIYINLCIKINKIIKEQSGNDKFETLLVIDSTTGQNGLEQARIFNEIVDLTGIILTKFDGTAKGGIIFPITEELKKPIKFIGVGEGIEDLREFDTKEFVEAMFD